MGDKIKYRTKQGEELSDYIKTIPGRHFTAKDICDHFVKKQKKIGTTTVYRHLEKMVCDGMLNKYVVDENSPACFEYVSKDSHCDKTCFHCKCSSCGKLIHMHCEELEEIKTHLLKDHGFEINSLRTVFYGTCSECRREGSGEGEAF